MQVAARGEGEGGGGRGDEGLPTAVALGEEERRRGRAAGSLVAQYTVVLGPCLSRPCSGLFGHAPCKQSRNALEPS